MKQLLQVAKLFKCYTKASGVARKWYEGETRSWREAEGGESRRRSRALLDEVRREVLAPLTGILLRRE
jgi:hypothetical protein